MDLNLSSILLGFIQGATEFLPVSSSGHLVIFQALFGFPYSLPFDVLVHLATVLAVGIYFRRELVLLFTSQQRMFFYLIIASLPTGMIGFLGRDFFEDFFSSVFVVGICLVLTGGVIMLGERFFRGVYDLEGMGILKAVIIGIFQGFAIMPGLSRSGLTISVCLALGFRRDFSARFAFLLSIPAILGAGLMESRRLIYLSSLEIGYSPLILGFISAFLAGYFSIFIFMRIVQRSSIRGFAYYCLGLGGMTLVIILSRSFTRLGL
jgi:undecaprenyl-diphosphatase